MVKSSGPPVTRTVTYDPAEMALTGRIGAHRLHATHDPRETTKNARAAFNQRFLDEVDPDGTLSEAERQRRAVHARKAYYQRLALKSAQARAKRKKRAAPDSTAPIAVKDGAR